MTTDWKPKWAPNTDLRSLTLTNVEGFLASRIDGSTTPTQLAQLTGLPPDQIKALLTRLVTEGALLPQPEEPKPEAAPAPQKPQPEAAPDPEADPDPDPGPDPATATDPDPDPDPEAEADPATDPERPLGDGPTHLAFYRQHYHHLSADERAARASNANGVTLSALCYDPLPNVIRKLMENPHTGLEQARLIAAHHHNSAGLEFLLAKAELMRDLQVQRLLWRNPQLNEGQLRRLTQTKRLLELWKLSVSREAISQTRTNTAKLLRTRFATAPAEERVELIFTTEGRALAGLSGLAVDGKTTSLLCARSYASMLLVQNLAHWSATPPALIAHLLRQPLVLRNPRLKTILSHHANAPNRGA